MIVLRYRYIKKHITYRSVEKICFIFPFSSFTWANFVFIICSHVLHRIYSNELLSPLFMQRVGPSTNTFDIICFLHLSTYQGTYYFLDGTGEWLTFGGYIWTLYWRRISNMYLYLSSFSCPVKLGLKLIFKSTIQKCALACASYKYAANIGCMCNEEQIMVLAWPGWFVICGWIYHCLLKTNRSLIEFSFFFYAYLWDQAKVSGDIRMDPLLDRSLIY